MKVLLLGKDGQVGRALKTALAGLGEVVALGHAEADFEQPGELPRLVAEQAPEIIVNAAAYTAVDKAEAEPERARLINAEAVALLAAAARRLDAWLVHYSTDYVFDGRKVDPYLETDAAAALSVYGATKHRGDLAIAGSGCAYLIFRVSWVYADGGSNFARTILRLARQKTALQVVGDQLGAPTSARLIAATTARAIARLGGNAGPPLPAGLYHLAAAGVVSRAEYARFVVAEALRRGAALALRPEAIEAIPTSAYPTPAARPPNSRLDTTKLRKALGSELPDWRQDARDWVTTELAAAAN